MSELIGSWVDGVAAHSIPIDDRGLQYGDGVFETILIRHQRARFVDAHLARVTLGCSRLGIPTAQLAGLRAEIDLAVSLAPPLAVLKIIVTRGSAARRGYAPVGELRPRRVITLFAAPAPPEDKGVSLRVASLRLAENPALAGLKHLNRLENVLAASEPGHDRCFDAILLSASGEVVGGTMSNVFAVRGGGLATPLVDRSGVAGVMRGIVIRECAVLGIPVEQRRFYLADLLTADEAFVTNARIGVVPVRSVGEHSFPMNEIATRLASHIGKLDA